MKMKNGIMLNTNFVDALSNFIKLQLPIKVSFPLQKCLKVFQTENTSVLTAKDELIKKYGVPHYNDKDEIIGWDVNKAPKENRDNFVKEYIELSEFDFDLPLEKKLEVNVKDIEDLKISTEHLMLLEHLVDFKE